MKQFMVIITLLLTLCVYNTSDAQFKNPKNAWAFSIGASHGTNATKDQWELMTFRGYFQHEAIPERLIAQLGLGYTGLVAPGEYSSYSAVLDARALYTPFSLPNLNPYIFGGFGVAKVLKNNSDFLPLIPVGAGVQSKLANGVLMDFNVGYTVVFSDELDGVARSNNNLNGITNGKHDAFYGVSLGVAFSLGSDADEPNTKSKELAEAEARLVKQQATAEARRVKELAEAEAVRVKQGADADAAAKLAKEQSDAKARRLAELNSRDTVIILTKGKTVILKDVNFEFNKATLTKDSEKILWRAYNAMVTNLDVKVVITGHTDEVGTQKSNQALSLERAQAVRNWLVEKGVASNRMRTVGRGKNEPVASNDTEEGRAVNRRIEFFVEQ